MAVKTILKVTPTTAVVKISDAGAQTISLANDLLFKNQTTGQIDVAGLAPAPTVNIRSINFSIPGTVNGTISRAGANVFYALGVFDLSYAGYSDSQNNTSDLVVTIPAGGGHIIVELLKIAGYGDISTLNQSL